MPAIPHPVLMLIPTQRTEVKELEQGSFVVCHQEGRQDKPLPTRDMEERKKNGSAVLIVPLNLSCL